RFRPQTYYQIEAKNRKVTFTWQTGKNESRIFNKKRAEQMVQQLDGQQATVRKVEKTKKKQFAPQLYDLTELQQDANRIFGFSGKQTLSAMQNLYERHKLLTYPRTDSRVITSDIVPTLKDRLDACGVDEYAHVANKLKKKQFRLPKSVVNDQQVTDHHAIIPTEEYANLSDLANNERKIYDLVVTRFLAVLSDPYEYEEMKVTLKIDGEIFSTKGQSVIQLGWKELTRRDNQPKELPTYKEQARLSNLNIALAEGETKPPARLTEGALLKAMENPAKYMAADEKHLTKTIQEAGGIGTVATRADIIDKL